MRIQCIEMCGTGLKVYLDKKLRLLFKRTENKQGEFVT